MGAEPIVLSGRMFSRAFLAVQQASEHSDEGRHALYRAVHVEVFEDQGVRLTATNSYWMAQSFAPHVDDAAAGDTCPAYYEVPDAAVTLVDDEWRLRDLMRHVAKQTKKEDAEDIPVVLDVDHVVTGGSQLVLDPSLEARRTRVEIPGRERVNVRLWEGEWMTWRDLWHRFMRDEVNGVCSATMLGPALFSDVCRSALMVGARLHVSWCDHQRAVIRMHGADPTGAPIRVTALVMGGTPDEVDRPHNADDFPLGPDDPDDGQIPGQQTITIDADLHEAIADGARHLEVVPT